MDKVLKRTVTTYVEYKVIVSSLYVGDFLGCSKFCFDVRVFEETLVSSECLDIAKHAANLMGFLYIPGHCSGRREGSRLQGMRNQAHTPPF